MQLTPLKPFNPVAKGTQGLPPACPNPSGDCWNGFPYVGASCIDTAFGTTNEGLLCDSKVGLGAAFVPICFNGECKRASLGIADIFCFVCLSRVLERDSLMLQRCCFDEYHPCLNAG
jgi:hypothetical protein